MHTTQGVTISKKAKRYLLLAIQRYIATKNPYMEPGKVDQVSANSLELALQVGFGDMAVEVLLDALEMAAHKKG